jgi:hypothetical protein
LRFVTRRWRRCRPSLYKRKDKSVKAKKGDNGTKLKKKTAEMFKAPVVVTETVLAPTQSKYTFTTPPSKKSLTWGPNKVKEFDLKLSIGKAPIALKRASPGHGVLKRRAPSDEVFGVEMNEWLVVKAHKKNRPEKIGSEFILCL